MNEVILIFIWQKINGAYNFERIVTDFEEAQRICASSSGNFVYTWQNAYHGEAEELAPESPSAD